MNQFEDPIEYKRIIKPLASISINSLFNENNIIVCPVCNNNIEADNNETKIIMIDGESYMVHKNCKI